MRESQSSSSSTNAYLELRFLRLLQYNIEDRRVVILKQFNLEYSTASMAE